MAIYMRGGGWWYEFEFQGRRVRASSCQTNKTAAMRHMQIQINWAAENFPSELLTVTIFGGFLQEA